MYLAPQPQQSESTIYHAHCHKMYVHACIVVVLSSLAGLVISAICSTETSALQLAVAAFYPAILLSGKLLFYDKTISTMM